MLAYLANTLIFIMVGVVITEKALSEIDLKDGFLIIVDYLGICVIRCNRSINIHFSLKCCLFAASCLEKAVS